MLIHAFCAVIAPAFASAAAYPWALPEPTLAIPAVDGWSPAPTAAPKVGGFELFPRAEGDTVCGFISGLSTSSLTCPPGKSSICATNTYFGVHGCCDPGNIENCDIPTTCVPSSLMPASCSDAKCSSNALVKKCTATEAPECFVWNFVYSTARTTTMTEWGCAAKHGTAIVERSWSSSSSKSSSSTRTTSSTASSSTEPSPTTLAQSQAPSKPNNTAAIVGGTVGGLVVVGAVASFIVYLLYRDRRLKREAAAHQSWVSGTTANNNNNPEGVTEFSPHGFVPANAWEADDNKTWGGSPTTVQVMGSPVMAETGTHGNGHATSFGVAEAHGQAVYEAPA
ncbi:hypothetical protein DM02DRAFT_22594 [Periconia macrospinosa]|uniref:Mid2 domain-containing protein n=1 Tax=Periconia macrospinosa TaxID=97972 RepID=A0A2V1DLD8_9PLEO|nr:hypothetical protein DM02DRAFT_22594 [Periconia macrospinosa]